MHYIKKVFARELRKNSTFEEQKVWEHLRNRRYNNLKFRRQHVIEGFVADFFCHELRLVIEIDGKVHEKQRDYDALRDFLIKAKGFNVIRVSNEEVNEDINNLLKKIDQATTLPLPPGEGKPPEAAG
jgi:very-short-patch-repair endonuclease